MSIAPYNSHLYILYDINAFFFPRDSIEALPLHPPHSHRRTIYFSSTSSTSVWRFISFTRIRKSHRGSIKFLIYPSFITSAERRMYFVIRSRPLHLAFTISSRPLNDTWKLIGLITHVCESLSSRQLLITGWNGSYLYATRFVSNVAAIMKIMIKRGIISFTFIRACYVSRTGNWTRVINSFQ